MAMAKMTTIHQRAVRLEKLVFIRLLHVGNRLVRSARVRANPVQQKEAGCEIGEYQEKCIARRVGMTVNGDENLNAKEKHQKQQHRAHHGNWQIDPTATLKPALFHN